MALDNNYNGLTKLKDWWGKVKANFTYLDERISTIITTPAEGVSAQEIIDARKGETALGDKIDAIDSNINEIKSDQASHKAETAYIINVLGEGVKGDDSTDDTAAIITAAAKAALFKAAGYKATLYFPPCKGYKTTGTVTVESGINVLMDAPIIYYGGENEPALVVGETDNENLGVKLRLNVKRSTVSDWTNEDSIGIKLYNCNTANIEIVQAKYFTIGLQCIGSSAGFAYNTVYLGYIIGNKYGIDLTNENTGTGVGWCNENLFIGGRIGTETGLNVGESRYGVRITSKAETKYYNNNNVFLTPSFELGATISTPGESIPILIEYGRDNSFLKIRNEGNSATTVRVLNESSENEITTGYGFISIDDQSVYPSTKYESVRTSLVSNANNCIFLSGPLHKKACYYDGATTVNVPNVHLVSSGSALPFNALNNITLDNNYVEFGIGRGVGIFVNTSEVKRFVVRKDTETGYGGRISIRCYDENGNILTAAGANHPYVKSRSGSTPLWGSSWGGVYGTGSDSNEDYYFTVHDDVKSIAVLLVKGTNVLRIRSFSIFAVDGGNCACYTGYEEIIPGCNLGTTPPTAGTWAKGRRVINAVPTVGQPKAWICTVEGTMGTLSGVTGSITSGTAALTVNTTTGLTVGNYITIAGVTGTKKIIAITDLVVTIDSNADATVTDAAVAYSNGTWVSEGNL